MERKLIAAVKIRALNDGAPNTKNGIATHVTEAVDISISVKAISNYLRSLENDEQISILKDIRDSLARYLGYSSYLAFIRVENRSKIKERRLFVLIIILIAVIVFLIYDCNKKKCMTWKEDRYILYDCKLPKAKPIDKELLSRFRKLSAECDINFYMDKYGKAKVFYYKNGEKDLDLFNMLEKHPINGIALKPITTHMIREHLCPEM